MTFGYLPFTNKKTDTTIDRKLTENYFEGKGYKIKYDLEDDEISDKIVGLIKKMLVPDPMKRIKWDELKT